MNWLKKLLQGSADRFVLNKVIGDSTAMVNAVLRINKAESLFSKAASVRTIGQGQLATITPLVETDKVVRGAAYYMEEISACVRIPATATVIEAVNLLLEYENAMIFAAAENAGDFYAGRAVTKMAITNRGGWSFNYHGEGQEKFYIATDYHTVLNLGG